MKGLMGVLLVLGAGTFLSRLALISIDDSGLREDVIFAPQVETTSEARAANIARVVAKRAQERGCAVEEGGVEVQVHDSVDGPMTVQGAGGVLKSNGPHQQVDITLRCSRKGVFFMPQVITIEVKTGTTGHGLANHYPPREGDEAPAPRAAPSEPLPQPPPPPPPPEPEPSRAEPEPEPSDPE